MNGGNNILLINKIHSSNLGDQAIGRTMEQLVRNLGSNPIVCDLTGGKRTTLANIPYKPILNRKKWAAIKTLKWFFTHRKSLTASLSEETVRSCRAVIVGGGEFIQDNNLFPPALLLWVRYIHKANPSIPIYLFGVGVTKRHSRLSRFMFSAVFRHVAGIYVRDAKSRENLQTIFHRSGKEIPDVVFASDFAGETHTKKNLALLGVTVPHRLKYYGYCGAPNEYYAKILDKYIELRRDYESVALMYDDNDDLATALEIQTRARQERGIDVQVSRYMDLRGFVDAISEAEHIESPRMHACILGLLNATEVKPVVISPKMSSFAGKYLADTFQIGQARQDVIDAMSEIIPNAQS